MIDAADSIAYVELDALLDTRLATIAKHDPEAAKRIFADPRYFERERDDFTELCGLDLDQFKALYAQRDLEVLTASTMTEMPFVLERIVRELEKDSIDTPFVGRTIVEVNHYPYKLDAESLENLQLGIMARAGLQTEVRMVYIEPRALTPTYVRGRYSGMILYSLRDWLENHLEEFKHVRMPRVTVMAPALYEVKENFPAAELRAEGLKENITPFILTELALIELFSLTLLPAFAFSIIRLDGRVRIEEPEHAPRLVLRPTREL